MARSKDQILYDLHNYNINCDTREIYLHSYYEEKEIESGVDYRQSTTFIKNLHLLDRTSSPILIHMHSEGGYWDSGMAMYNAIQFCKSSVRILAYAQASSMSGVILQAAYPYRVMMPDCHFMLHHGSLSLESDSIAALSVIKQNERNCTRMLEIFGRNAQYSIFFKKKKSSLDSVMKYIDDQIRKNGDWYLDAEQAVYYGFADHILGSKAFPDIESLRKNEK